MIIEANSVDKKEFDQKVNYIEERAFEDQCTTANPTIGNRVSGDI